MTGVEHPQGELPLTRPPQTVAVPIELVRSKKTKGGAFTLACDASGLEDKEIAGALNIDKALFSRLKAGSASLDDDLLADFCRVVGNKILPEWLAYQVGCTLVIIQTEAERIAAAERARADEFARENKLLRELLQGKA